MPKVFRLTKGGKLIAGVFEGETINTPSMLCVEDYLDALAWAESIGGLEGAAGARRRQRQGALRLGRADAVARALAADPATRSNTSVCLKIADPAVAKLPVDAQRAFVKQLEAIARQGERRAATSPATAMRRRHLRIWCGSTVETADLRGAHPLARLGLRRGQGRARQGGVACHPAIAALAGNAGDAGQPHTPVRTSAPHRILAPHEESREMTLPIGEHP